MDNPVKTILEFIKNIKNKTKKKKYILIRIMTIKNRLILILNNLLSSSSQSNLTNWTIQTF